MVKLYLFIYYIILGVTFGGRGGGIPGLRVDLKWRSCLRKMQTTAMNIHDEFLIY